MSILTSKFFLSIRIAQVLLGKSADDIYLSNLSDQFNEEELLEAHEEQVAAIEIVEGESYENYIEESALNLFDENLEEQILEEHVYNYLSLIN